jgi:hypothetical protein
MNRMMNYYAKVSTTRDTEKANGSKQELVRVTYGLFHYGLCPLKELRAVVKNERTAKGSPEKMPG